ncbi:MAG: hypothetical protein U9R25_16115 [Chloroflexota bacterium]|nr:hypothetical protein [Chloroflexota bacterium]
MITLDVYVSTGCANCAYARELAVQVARAFPAVEVNVLELGEIESPPETVFATPTYLLDRKRISLGNPDHQELYSLLDVALNS